MPYNSLFRDQRVIIRCRTFHDLLMGVVENIGAGRILKNLKVFPCTTKPESTCRLERTGEYGTSQLVLWKWRTLPLLRELARRASPSTWVSPGLRGHSLDLRLFDGALRTSRSQTLRWPRKFVGVITHQSQSRFLCTPRKKRTWERCNGTS